MSKSTRLLLFLLLAAASLPAAGARSPELLLVYWGSADCGWCAYWESERSGLARQLLEAEELKRITYRVVKNERLSDPYLRAHFPADIHWLYERHQRGEERRPGRPGWVLYADRKRIAAFHGATHFEERHLPEILRLIRAQLRD